MFENLIKSITDENSDKMLEKILTENYDKNLFVLVTAAQKFTLRAIIEASIRGETGKPLSRTYGSPNVQSPWEKIFLNPTQLFKLPTKDTNTIKTDVVIGKNCGRPLNLKMPVIITGMSYGGSLSMKIKEALAAAATNAGTATNTGEAPLNDIERKAAARLIGQYNRYHKLMDPEELSKLDAIEIQLGQGAWGGAVPTQNTNLNTDEQMRSIWNLDEGEVPKRESRFNNINNSSDIVNLVNDLKNKYDIPVGIKIAGTHFIEKELDVVIKTNADFITIDGAEGGTAGAPPTLEDDLGLPTLYSISRADKYLTSHNVREKYDIIAAGGLKTPGDFLKAMALGANAVYIGSIAVIAALQSQTTKVTPFETTSQLFLYGADHADDFNVEKGTATLTNFLNSCNEEMKLALTAMGKQSITDLKLQDLVTVDKQLAEALGIGYAGEPCI